MASEYSSLASSEAAPIQNPRVPSIPDEILLSPRIKLTNKTTASELLIAFSPKYKNLQSKHQHPSSPGSPKSSIMPMLPIAMTGTRSLRQKEKVQYVVSDGSEASSPKDSSAFSSPGKRKRKRSYVDLDSENDVDEVEPPRTPPPRLSSAGHSLRQHSVLNLSLRAKENGDKQVKRRRKYNVSRRQSKPKLISDAPSNHPVRTARNIIRDIIANETALKRSNFFVAKKDYFLPLLPENNYISRLVEQRLQKHSLERPLQEAAGGADDEADEDIFQYEELVKQPNGVVATMKPYQLKGLSFLVYLQRNGLSGILGDEMGLGKTLQTLSLIQHIKETRYPVEKTTQTRPCLVVCPLSVLSSWMAESRRWTPGLKVLRFHGPMNERTRLKRVASGEEDMYGNDTCFAINKRNKKLAAAGKQVVDLSSGNENEDEGSVGVDVVVTTYETFTAEQQWFKRAFVWKYVILDEGHKIKNEMSLISTALQGLGAEYRLILTGTPLQNNLTELWALLHWLYPEVFTGNTSELFKDSFDLSKGRVSTTVLDDARRLLELIMLRRMKTSPGVDLNLPQKTDVLLFVPLSPMQRFWYTRLLTKVDKGLLDDLFVGAKEKEAAAMLNESQTKMEWENKDIEELIESQNTGSAGAGWEESKEIMRRAIEQEQLDKNKNSSWRKLMNLLMQLRKCCNHPYLLPHASPDPYYLGEHVVKASGKFIVLDKIINELVIRQKKKVLIFSGFTSVLDYCEDFLHLRGGNGQKFKYSRLDGGTSRARRNLSIRLFNQVDSEYRVMLISTRAGGLGINLATASDVILLDQDWNPQITLQAEARAHRIGQTNPVTVYKLVTQGSVEEQMMGRIQKKLYLSSKVTESMRDIHTPKSSKRKGRLPAANDNDAPQLSTTQLMSLVRRGTQALSHPELDVDEMLGWTWETMLENCKDKPADIHVQEATQKDVIVKEDDEKKWLAQIEHVESRVFAGKKWMKENKDGKNSILEEYVRADRRKGKNTTVMVDGFAISKESMQCGDWEAVPTMAGKDPRLAEPKRERRASIKNQEQCQVCWDGGHLVICSSCPRSYHTDCLDKHFKPLAKSKMSFHCPQHQCADCQQKTSDAGGMIYRCRWCERGYCEDCLDFENAVLIGETLKEYEILGFGQISQAFYIECPACREHHRQFPEAKVFCANMAAQYDRDYASNWPPSRDESLTDATTLVDSGISTPRFLHSKDSLTFSTGKSKLGSGSLPTNIQSSTQVT